MSAAAIATTLLKKDSTAVYIGEQGKPPVVTAGKLTLDLLFDFENGAFSYFAYKDLPENKRVFRVAGGLQDARVQTWYRLNRTAIDAAGFANFMTTVRANWLDPGWEQEVKLLILSSSQGSTPVSDWIMLLECTNALIKGTTCELNGAELHNHIQSHVHPDTMSAATHAELHLIATFPAYKRGLRTIDDARVRADELLQAAVKQMMTSTVTATRRVNSRAVHNYTNNASSSNNNATPSATSSVAPSHVPALTSSERSCFKSTKDALNVATFTPITSLATASAVFLTQPRTRLSPPLTRRMQRSSGTRRKSLRLQPLFYLPQPPHQLQS